MQATSADQPSSTVEGEGSSQSLSRLAQLNGVSESYLGLDGQMNPVDESVLVGVLEALGVPASSPEQVEGSLQKALLEQATTMVPGTVFSHLGHETRVLVRHKLGELPSATVRLEDGSDFGASLAKAAGDGTPAFAAGDDFFVDSAIIIPATMPMGYHTLTVTAGGRSAQATLIVAPERVPLPAVLQQSAQWGWMTQLYSVRSHASWGVGDFADLSRLLVDAHHKTGADYMLINPVHAGEPVTPLTPSPYLPDSRRFINVTYIRPEAIEEYAALSPEAKARVNQLRESVQGLNAQTDRIDRNAMWQAKLPALREIFAQPRSQTRQAAFEAFKQEQGPDLDAFAAWCVGCQVWGVPTYAADTWVRRYSIDSPEVAWLRQDHVQDCEFYRWLQWVATAQLAAAQQAAKDAGMSIGLVLDMAVGVHLLGPDLWANPDQFATGVHVGAPPDFYNQQGQDWTQPALNPRYLKAKGYKPYRDLVHNMFKGAGALRIDHILGLFRLWWIPAGNPAAKGTYVAYDSDVMLGILAIEATRAGGVIVGEDLGVVPPQVASALSSRGLLGSVIEWFERDSQGLFRQPDSYREYAMTSVTTHDLPPTAGYLNFEQVKLRQQLGLFASPEEAANFESSARYEHESLLHFLVNGGWLDPAVLDDETAGEQQIVEAMHKVIKASKSKLLCAALVDGVGERRAQNQPGTDNEYPNWRIPLADGQGQPVFVEEVFDLPRVQSLGRVMDA